MKTTDWTPITARFPDCADEDKGNFEFWIVMQDGRSQQLVYDAHNSLFAVYSNQHNRFNDFEQTVCLEGVMSKEKATELANLHLESQLLQVERERLWGLCRSEIIKKENYWDNSIGSTDACFEIRVALAAIFNIQPPTPTNPL